MRGGFLRATMAALAGTLLSAPPLFAGNIVLTAPDDGLHGSVGSAAAGAQLSAMVAFAQNGSTTSSLPVLAVDAIDSGDLELDGELAALGIAHTVKLSGAVAVDDFNPATYSAFVLASSEGGGDCDLTDAGDAKSAAIASFFASGSGIVGLAEDALSTYDSFVRVPVSPSGDAGPLGCVQTACGATRSIPAINGDPTRNFFAEQDTDGVDAAYCSVERQMEAEDDPGIREATLGTSTGLTAIPEPASLTLLGLGLAGAIRRLRRS